MEDKYMKHEWPTPKEPCNTCLFGRTEMHTPLYNANCKVCTHLANLISSKPVLTADELPDCTCTSFDFMNQLCKTDRCKFRG
jgi:hypothetical protein